MKKHFLLFIFILISMIMKAYDAKIDGIYYNFNQETKTAVVTYQYSGAYHDDANKNAYSGDVVIPDTVAYNGVIYTVTSISNRAFYYCKKLTSITIPNSVNNIGDEAFNLCDSLSSVHISDLVSWCSIKFERYKYYEDYLFSGANPLYYAKHLFLNGEEIKNLIIPDNVTTIEDDAFYGGCYIESVTIPNSVTSICNAAFYYCSKLSSINLSPNITSIGVDAFNGCNLNDVKVSVTDLSAFCNNKVMKQIRNRLNKLVTLVDDRGNEIKEYVIPNDVTSVGNSAFENCTGLSSVAIPNNVTSIGEESFRDCTGLTSIAFPSSVTLIGSYAFSGCGSLTSINFSPNITSIGENAFKGCNINDVKVSVTDLSAFCNNIVMKQIRNSLDKPVTLVDDGGNEINEYVIPNDVTSVGNSAFENCTGLISVTIPDCVTTIGVESFIDCTAMTSITIPSSVTYIGDEAFRGCKGLNSVVLCCNTTSVGKKMFSGCDNIKEVEFDCDKIMPIFSGFTSIEKITIKEGAASIDDNAFSECSGITSVEIPSSIISIGSGAFYRCYNINDSQISLNNVATIGDKAFYGCSKIKNITLSKNLTTISAYVFYECSGLTSIEIPNSVTSIGNNAFNGCSGISNSIKVPNSVTIIGDYAFNKCNNVKDFYVGDGVTNIGKCAFANCDKMENFYCYAYHYPKTKDDVFKDSYIDYVTLYVPKDAVNQYKAVEPWKNFKEIVGVDYESGIFLANTENACIQCTGGMILLSGIELGKMINVYDVSGKLVVSAKSNTNKMSICTNLKKGEVAIIKIGDKSVKVVME